MIDLGVGLWTMRSTARRPAAHPFLYRCLQEDAKLAEVLGFHSLWLAEHHFSYDGWCPAVLTAAATALGATKRLRVGTGIHLLPLWDVASERSAVDTLARIGGRRLLLGVGLGYRDAEYHGLGVNRRLRGREMDATLDQLLGGWSAPPGGPPVLIGGFSEAALRRAGKRGLGIFLPFSMDRTQLQKTIERYRAELSAAGQTAGRVAMMKYVWLTDGARSSRDQARRTIIASAREYTGAWFPLRGRIGFDAPDLLEQQLRRAADHALIGSAAEIAHELGELVSAGVDLVVLMVTRDDTGVDHRRQMAMIGEQVLPRVASPCA